MIEIDDRHALMDQSDFDALPDYDPKARQRQYRMSFRGLWWYAWRESERTHHRQILVL